MAIAINDIKAQMHKLFPALEVKAVVVKGKRGPVSTLALTLDTSHLLISEAELASPGFDLPGMIRAKLGLAPAAQQQAGNA